MKLLQQDGRLDLKEFNRQVVRKPELFASGCEPFWDAPYISKQMLKAHLDQGTDAASRTLDVVDATIEHLRCYLELNEEASVLDLGCGPGLYAERFARCGCFVTGIDCSERSIDYARKKAQESGLEIRYEVKDFCDLDYQEEFDAAFIIYGQLGALVEYEREQLLKSVNRALKPGGYLVFDVTTRYNRDEEESQDWAIVPAEGFWRPEPHLVLEKTFHYPEAGAYLDQHAVIQEDGQVSVYRIWECYFSRKSVSELMSRHGFVVENVWSELTGSAYFSESPWLAVAARKKTATY